MSTLLDLPVLPRDRDSAVVTNVIMGAYVTERKAVTTLTELTLFVGRWKPIWELACPLKPDMRTGPVPTVTEAVLGHFLEMINPKYQLHGEVTPDQQSAMNILLPPAALQAFILCRKYLCDGDADIGFVRLFLDPYPEHEAEMRG
jgi:hypothetical protein